MGGPDRPEFLRLKAASAVNSGDYAEAENDLKEGLQLQPANINLLLNYGNLLRRTKRPEEASEIYLKALGLDPANSAALESLGYLARETGDLKAAAEYFKKLSRIDPNDYVAYLALGDMRTDQREFAQAQENYEKAYKLAADNPIIIARAMNAAAEASGRSWGTSGTS